MGERQPPLDYNDPNDQSYLDRTQPSPTRPRRLDWRPPDYRSSEVPPGQEIPPESGARPPLRRVSQPGPRRRRPPTEGAPAWLVGLGVGALLAVILLLGAIFILSRRPAESEPTATVKVVTPTATLPPRPTATTPAQVTDTPEPTTEQAPAPTAPPPESISVGGYVRIVAPAGLSFRQTASTDGALIQVLDNGVVLAVIGGPEEAGGYTWWKLRKLDDNQEGWSAAGSGEDVFLAPASAP
jgi:hypothetical protein